MSVATDDELEVRWYLRCDPHRPAQHGFEILEPVGEGAEADDRGQRKGLELEARDHTEESGARAARCPQIIAVLRLVGVDQPALRVDQIDCAHVGAADAELTGVPAPAAVEQVAAESHRAVMAGWKHATALAQLAIEMPAFRAGSGPGALAARLERYFREARDIDQQHLIAQVRGR